MLRPWAFTAMLAQVGIINYSYLCIIRVVSSQVPLAIITEMELLKGQISNVIVWISLLLGQPLAILMYMHDYYLLNQTAD